MPRNFDLQKNNEWWNNANIMHISHSIHSGPVPPPSAVVLGCGNVLFGDDGFGPAVIAALQDFGLPETVRTVDAGTSIREYLLDYLLLPELRPQLLVVVDAGFEQGSATGELRLSEPAALPLQKIHDYSLHQFPTVNLLRELREETGIVVLLLIAQTASLPDSIAPGLSPAMQSAVLEACGRIVRLVAPYTILEVTTP